LIDDGSIVNIIYNEFLNRMEATPEAARVMLHPHHEPLYGFDGREECFSSMASLPVQANPYFVITEFHVIDVPSPYNVILGRPWIHMRKQCHPATTNSCVTLLLGDRELEGRQGCLKAVSQYLRRVRLDLKDDKARASHSYPVKKKQKQAATITERQRPQR